MSVVDLEIGLHDDTATTWLVEAHSDVSDPNNPMGIGGEDAVRITLDLRALARATRADYPGMLTAALFGGAGHVNGIGEFVGRVRTLAARLQPAAAVRMRLRFGPGAEALHAVRWERLLDPDDRTARLAMHEGLYFSRWIDSPHARTATLRTWREMRAVIAVAGWGDDVEIGGRWFAAVDTDDEIERATTSLATRHIVTVGRSEAASVDNIVAAMGRRDGCDVLYLVCHGFTHEGATRLLLHSAHGKPEIVPAEDLVRRLRTRLTTLPRLVIVVSCQSAQAGATRNGGQLQALGPQLAKIGIPAVVAMQDDITLETATAFFPALVAELRNELEVDQAMARARERVATRPDWWVPVLFTRQRHSRVAYRSGFASKPQDWDALVEMIGGKEVTPVVGRRLLAPYVGDLRELARDWARTFEYPLQPPFDEDLPQVAQYLANVKGPNFPRQRLRRFIARQLLSIHGDDLKGDLPKPLKKLDPAKPADMDKISRQVARNPELLDELLRAAGRARRKRDPTDGHAVLARLEQEVYLTTQASSLLTDALAEREHVEPAVEYFRWREDAQEVGRDGAVAIQDEAGRPVVRWPRDNHNPYDVQGSLSAPLVYHLFGHIRFPNSVVLTEDDYFDYMYAAGRKKADEVPWQIQNRVMTTSLLLVGFGIDEWSFRVLFRFLQSLKPAPGSRLENVAVQLDPQERGLRSVEQYKAYLEKALGADFSIYWGSAQEFLSELAGELDKVGL